MHRRPLPGLILHKLPDGVEPYDVMVFEVQQLQVVPTCSLLVSSMMDDLNVEVSQSIQRALGYYHTKELDQYSSECFLVSNREIESSNIKGGFPSTHRLT